MNLHVFTTHAQPATRWRDDMAPLKYRWHTNPPNRLLPAVCCGKRRPAKNLGVLVYYDHIGFRCAPGKGCKVPRRRMPPARRLLSEFQEGRSFVGLARKYGRTSREIQAAIRRYVNRRDRRGQRR